jgi:hypothetical protein
MAEQVAADCQFVLGEVMINFVYQAGAPYSGVLDAFVAPITEHLPSWKKSQEAQTDALNVRFFVEWEHGGAFIPHGIADKNYRNADKLAGFDYIFVSGPAWSEKLIKQGYPAEKIYIGGYTKLDPAFSMQKTPGWPRILYAPTHAAIEEVSLQGRFDADLAIVAEYYEVISSAHPAYSGKVTMQALVDADVVIADSGSILYEAWALNKPVIFPDWLLKEGVEKHFPGSFEEQIYREGMGYHAESPQDLLGAIKTALHYGLDDTTRRFIDGIFPPELRGKSGEATAKILKELVSVSFNCPKFVEEFKGYVKSLKGTKSILEVGALSGELMDAVEAEGIDIDPQRESVHKCDIRQYRGKKRDLIFSSGLIEHYGEPEAVEILQAMARASNKYVLTYAPHTNCAAYMTAKAKTKAEWKGELDFTPDTLAALHEKAGLTVVGKGVAAVEWAKLFGPEPSEGYLVYVLAEIQAEPKEEPQKAPAKKKTAKK